MKMQRIILFAILVILLLNGCGSRVDQYKDAVLIIEQYPAIDSSAWLQGIRYVRCTMTWNDNSLEAVNISATFINESEARLVYSDLKNEGVETWIEGDVVHYKQPSDLWQQEGTTYLDMVELYENDSEWRIVRDNSD